jgi:anti-anti-sigma regulatory factor
MPTLLARTPDLQEAPPLQALPAARSEPAPAPVRAPAAAPAPAQRAGLAPRGTVAEPRLVLSGELTAADRSWLAPELQRLAASGAETVAVDLSDVPLLDAAVARLLLRTSWHLGDPSRRLLLVHVTPQVHRVLRFYGAGHLVVRERRRSRRSR